MVRIITFLCLMYACVVHGITEMEPCSAYPELQNYVAKLGTSLNLLAKNYKQNYDFWIACDDVATIAVVANNQVSISDKLLLQLNNEAELAAAMAFVLSKQHYRSIPKVIQQTVKILELAKYELYALESFLQKSNHEREANYAKKFLRNYRATNKLVIKQSEYQKMIMPLREQQQAYLFFKQARLSFLRQEYDHSIELVKQAIALESEEALFYKLQGDAYVGKLAYTDALAVYNKALRLNPRYKEALLARANLYRELEHKQFAYQDLLAYKQLAYSHNSYFSKG